MFDGIGDGVEAGGSIDKAGVAPGVFGIEGEPVGGAPVDSSFDSPALRGVSGFGGAGVADVNEFAIALQIPKID